MCGIQNFRRDRRFGQGCRFLWRDTSETHQNEITSWGHQYLFSGGVMFQGAVKGDAGQVYQRGQLSPIDPGINLCHVGFRQKCY